MKAWKDCNEDDGNDECESFDFTMIGHGTFI